MSKETIGPYVKKFRKKRGLTQKDLADSLGYSHKSVITHIEKGDSEMSFEKILLMLKTYNVDANDLFEIDRAIDEREKYRREHRKVVVYIHGLHGSSKEANDYSYLNDEYDVKGLDYPDGNPWELKDSIRNEFKKLIDNYQEIVVIANSIGAFYTYEYLSDFNIKQAFFISPVASMFQITFNIMMSHGISERELEEKKYIRADDKTLLSYDFYQHVKNDKDNWNVPTEILYGSNDDLIYIENIAEFLENHPLARLTIKRGSEHHFHTPEEKQFIKDWIIRNISLENEKIMVKPHYMNLQPGPFSLIKSGQKTVEMRLYDERRKCLRIGDIIGFINTDTKEELYVEIIDLKQFKSFDELYKNYDKSALGYKDDEAANPDDMLKYYSKDMIEKYGVLAIEIKLY